VKHNKVNFNYDEIKNYSQPMTDENLQNIANLFTRGIAEKTITRTRRPRILRVALAAVMSVVMIFAVGIAANAEFREMFFGMFTPTETEEIADGLKRDSFLIFDMELKSTEAIMLGTLFDTIFIMDVHEIENRTHYEYSKGGLNPIETERVSTTFVFNDMEYDIVFDHGIRENGKLIAYQAGALDISSSRNPYFVVAVIPNRTDAVIIGLGTVAGAILNENWLSFPVMHKYVLFDLATLEITDEIVTQEMLDLAFDTSRIVSSEVDGATVIDEYVWLGGISPDGKWLFYTPTNEWRNDFYLYNMETGAKFNIDEEALNGKPLWNFTWLADDVLAVVTGGEGTHLGKHLYVFRISEEFLSAE
jgi:hypothetical protein